MINNLMIDSKRSEVKTIEERELALLTLNPKTKQPVGFEAELASFLWWVDDLCYKPSKL